MTLVPPIHIVGGGLAGLTLARCLRNRGIRGIIFEKNPSPAKHNYGITLQPRTCQALLKVLGTDERSFRGKVAVDSLNSGSGLVSSDRSNSVSEGFSLPFRAHCGRLEAALRDDLKIQWSHVLENVSRSGDECILEFKDEKTVDARLMIDTSGVHSRVKKALLPKLNLDVLSYVVFRGTRRIDGRTFKELYQSKFQGGTTIDLRKDDVLLQIWINDYQGDSESVDISYVYSRPTRENDSLHRPGRAPGESSDISESFFEELTQLSELEQPFRDAFDGEKLKKDRILHWLMRSCLAPLDELIQFSRIGVVFLGDSAHTMPILGGEGANFAIQDAVELAEYIAEKGIEGVEDFYRKRYGEWENEVKGSKERLHEMHEMHSTTRSVL
ncbi:FAD/NAD(P)-binding domain-containing protein [Mollisia scopiformis]|uniref:FAD/NAD(P)-binding domain-containing protein n=1 Tax=Mollisia scopiformis TaxID=149040 RepID=A0A194XQL0_MOLSC|nr:FAD/NAD(P)-binding domain-containing protein [Mollisia scopiformis]KUJ22483.1 FAD/NAD(P)-binding domain-containing protein [Mollisia scopiformis]